MHDDLELGPPGHLVYKTCNGDHELGGGGKRADGQLMRQVKESRYPKYWMISLADYYDSELPFEAKPVTPCVSVLSTKSFERGQIGSSTGLVGV
jgi:hypothetical protein